MLVGPELERLRAERALRPFHATQHLTIAFRLQRLLALVSEFHGAI
jgi:hypothetical protein